MYKIQMPILSCALAILLSSHAFASTTCVDDACYECPVEWSGEYNSFEKSITCYECDWYADNWQNGLPRLKNTGCTAKISKTNAKGITNFTFTYRDENGKKQTIKYKWQDQESTDEFIYKGHVCSFWWDCIPFGIFLTVDGEEYSYVLTSKSSGTVNIPDEWKKARILNGAWGECDDAEGVCQLKLGKANRKGVASASLKVTKFNGSTVNYGTTTVDVSGGGDLFDIVWKRKSYHVDVNADGEFFGEPIYYGERPCCSPNSVWSANVGGNVDGYHYLALADDWDEWWDYEYALLKAAKLNEYLCAYFNDHDGVEFVAKGKKWVSTPSEYTRSFNLSYNPATGIFKGTMKIGFGDYCVEGEDEHGRAVRGKTISLKVNGGCIDGQFKGSATYKNVSIPIWGE